MRANSIRALHLWLEVFRLGEIITGPQIPPVCPCQRPAVMIAPHVAWTCLPKSSRPKTASITRPSLSLCPQPVSGSPSRELSQTRSECDAYLAAMDTLSPFQIPLPQLHPLLRPLPPQHPVHLDSHYQVGNDGSDKLFQEENT